MKLKGQKEEREKKSSFNLAPLTLYLLLTSLPGEHSESEPPDPIPNSAVKPLSADDSVAGCHAKVGNCQAFNMKTQVQHGLGFFLPERKFVVVKSSL